MKHTMSEKEMQDYANNKEGYEVEFLFEYALGLGYRHKLLNEETSNEGYLFYKN